MGTQAAGALALTDEATQRQWAEFAKSRDPQLRVSLIERYLPLARGAATRLFRLRPFSGVPYADYLQYARVGLVEAVDGFDPSREASFETYSSYRIRGAMLNGLTRETESAAQRSFWRTRVEERVGSLKPSITSSGDEELQELAHMTVGLAIGFLLDDQEEVADETLQGNPYAATELLELRAAVRAAVGRLPPREQQLIQRHYFEHCDFRSIAREMRVTPGRVSQIHSQSLQQIRLLLKRTVDLDRNV